MPLKDAVHYLKDVHGIEIQIDAKALGKAGVKTGAPITRNIKGVTLDSALRLTLEQSGLVPLIRDDVLLITTEKESRRLLQQGAIDPAAYAISGKAAATRWIAESLKKTASLSVVKKPLCDVLHLLSDDYRLEIQMDRRRMHQVGVKADVPCTITLKDVSLNSILRQLLTPLGLTYVVRDEVVLVTVAKTPKAAVPKASDQSGKRSAAKSEGQITFAGLCHDDQGRPIAGAEVLLYRVDLMGNRTQRLLQTERTNKDGKFQFAPVDDLSKGMPAWQPALPQAAPYGIHARATGRATVGEFVPQSSIDSGHIDMRMPEGATLSGKVTGPDGKPVKGATVWAIGPIKPIPGIGSATTDAAGQFEIRDLRKMDLTKPPASATTWQTGMPLHIRCPGFGDKKVEYSKVPGTVDVQLERAAVVEGRVIYGDQGARAVGVRVQFQGIKNGSFGTAVTDADGRYRFDSLGPDKYNIWAVKDGYTMRAIDSLEAVPGTTKTAPDLRLVPGGFIVGHVVDADTGQPFYPSDAKAPPWFRPDVALYGHSRPRSGPACEVTPIRADGWFSIRAAPGKNHVYLRIYNASQAVPPAAIDVDVVEGQTVTIEFKVRRGTTESSGKTSAETPEREKKMTEALTYTGLVTDKLTGKPIADATVVVRRMIVAPYEQRTIETTQHTTDAAGKYRFTIPPEQVAQGHLFIEVEASHPAYVARKDGYGFAMIHRNEQLGQRPFFEHMELFPGQQISGTVITPDGKPAAGVKVVGFTMPDRNDIDSHHFPIATTDAKGFFCLTVARSDNQSVSETGVGRGKSPMTFARGCDAVFWLLPKDYALSTYANRQAARRHGTSCAAKGDYDRRPRRG